MPRRSSRGGLRRPTPTPPPAPGPYVGPRRTALESRRKEERKKAAIVAAAIGVAAAAVVGLASLIGDDRDGSEAPETDPVAVEEDDATTTLLLLGTRRNEADEARVVWVSLVTLNREDERGSIIYIPAHTAVEVPGRGLQGLDDAWETGGIPLVLVSVENVLEVPIDGYVELSENDALVTLEEVGPLSIDVPEEVRVPAGRNLVRLILGVGRQQLAAPFQVDLLYTLGVDGNDLDLGSRHLAFWDGLFEAFADDPGSLGRAVRSAGGALAESDVPPNRLGALFGDLAALPPSDRAVRILPVTPLEVPGNRLYATDEGEVRSLVSELIGEGTGTGTGSGDTVRVQILNGNGVPGIGQEVADLLVGQGFRVILSGNAPRLNYRTTKIVTYDSSPEGQALARRAQELLKVGEVQVSLQEQGIVDLTIVVGKDFLRVR